jgi:hypothetical protein
VEAVILVAAASHTGRPNAIRIVIFHDGRAGICDKMKGPRIDDSVLREGGGRSAHPLRRPCRKTKPSVRESCLGGQADRKIGTSPDRTAMATSCARFRLRVFVRR